jgi:AraC family transcriptional regulator, transcriptional activator of pobA
VGPDTDLPTYERFDDYYVDARAAVRTSHPDFHIFRTSALGGELVEQMGPFRTTYYQFALGSELHGNVGVFETEQVIESHAAVIYLPGQILRWEKTGLWDGYVINVREEFLDLPSIRHLTDSYAYLHSLDPLVFQMPREDYRILSGLCELMLVEQGRLQEENLMVIRNLMQVLVVYFNRLVSATRGRASFGDIPYQDVATRFRSMVVRHYLDHRAVAAYADALGVTPAYLTIAVKRVYDRTPKQVINDVLLLHARTALTTSDLSMKEIAHALRFEDYSYFTRFFKKMTGVSPSAYRRREHMNH